MIKRSSSIMTVFVMLFCVTQSVMALENTLLVLPPAPTDSIHKHAHEELNERTYNPAWRIHNNTPQNVWFGFSHFKTVDQEWNWKVHLTPGQTFVFDLPLNWGSESLYFLFYNPEAGRKRFNWERVYFQFTEDDNKSGAWVHIKDVHTYGGQPGTIFTRCLAQERVGGRFSTKYKSAWWKSTGFYNNMGHYSSWRFYKQSIILVPTREEHKSKNDVPKAENNLDLLKTYINIEIDE